MNRRDSVLALIALGAAAGPLAALAQQPEKMRRIGYLLMAPLTEPPSPERAALLEGLRALGYVEGRNLTIEYCWAHNDNARLPELAADLVRQRMAVRSTLQRRTVSAIHYPVECASAALRAAICALALLTSAWRMRATPTSC